MKKLSKVEPKPRVAIQYCGLVRGFRFEDTRAKIYENLIKPLKNQGYGVDIFWYTYDLESNDVIYNLDKNKFNVVKLVVDSDDKMQDYLENEYKLLDKYNFPPAWSRNGIKRDSTGLDYDVSEHYLKYGWFKWVYSIKKVTELRNEYEKENGAYDWVITTAAPVEPQNKIDDLRKLDNKNMYSPGYAQFGGVYDSFFIGNADHMNYMGTLYDCAINQTLGEKLIDAEPVLQRFINKKYTINQTLNIRFNRIRYNGSRKTH